MQLSILKTDIGFGTAASQQESSKVKLLHKPCAHMNHNWPVQRREDTHPTKTSPPQTLLDSSLCQQGVESGASGKCEEPPPLQGCQGKHGPAQTLCQWVGGPRQGAAPGHPAGAQNGTPSPSPGPGIGHLPQRLAQAARFVPPSSVPLTVHLHPRRGYRPSRLRASEGRRGEPSELPHPPRRCYRSPTPSLPARPLGPRFAIAAAFCHCLRLCSRCFSLPPRSEATPTVRSHSPLAAGPRPGPGGGRGLIRAGGVAGRIGWSSRPAAAACRGHC